MNRLGELSQASLITDAIESLNKGERALTEAEEYGYGIGEGTAPEHMGQTMADRVQKGVKFRFLAPEDRLSANMGNPAFVSSVEVRGLPDLPVLMVLTEKEAGVFFLQNGGGADYAGFYGKDATFLNWAKDLFQHYWDKGKRA